MLPGFPKPLPSDGASSPRARRPRRRQPQRADLRHLRRRSSTRCAATAPSCRAGRCTATRCRCTPAATPSPAARSTQTPPTARSSPRSRSRDLDRDGSPEVVAADMEGKLYVWNADGSLRFKREAEHRLLRQAAAAVRERAPAASATGPSTASSARRWSPTSTATAATSRSSPRHGPPRLRVARGRRRRCAGFPVLVVDRSKISAIDPQTHAPTFNAAAGDGARTRARSSTRPRSATSTATASPRSWSAPTRSTRPADDGGFNAGNLNTASLARARADRAARSSATRRLYAIKPEGEPGGPTVGGPSPFLAGWPVKVGIINTELLPVVGEGITGCPVIGPVDCATRRQRRRRSARSGNAGPGVHLQPGRQLLLRPDRAAQRQRAADRLRRRHAASTTRPRSRPSATRRSATSAATSPSFLTPAAGVLRALDLGGQRVPGRPGLRRRLRHRRTGQFRPGLPDAGQRPPVHHRARRSATSTGCPARRSSAAPRRSTCTAFNAAGAPASTEVAEADLRLDGRQPGDRLVRHARHRRSRAQGGGRADPRGHAVRLHDRRARLLGRLVAAFHHDNANSGDYRRDATLPGQAVRRCAIAGDDAHLQGARRRPAVRHRRPLRGRAVERPDHGRELLERGAGRRRARARGRRARPSRSPLPAEPEALRRDPRRGRAGQRRPASRRSRLRRATRGRRRATPVYLPLVPAFEPCTSPNRIARRAARLRLPATRRSRVRTADGRHARRERQARGVLRLVR